MSQPWRPSRGTGASKWGNSDRSTGNASSRPSADTRPRQYEARAAPQDAGISGQGMRQANLRPLRQNKMDFSSPSRGELTPGRSLTDKAAQDEFRAHLEDRIRKYQTVYPDELAIILQKNQKQKDELDVLLLEFRKLREGIISSGRKDDFAIEVYETSAKLALLSKNIPQIASILPHLVITLHRLAAAATRNEESGNLEDSLLKLRLGSMTPVAPDTRARFLCYYLLHLVCHMEDVKAFQSILRETVSFGEANDDSVKVGHNNKHVLFACKVFHCYIRNDYAALSKITLNPRSNDKFAWIIVRSTRDAFRARAWQTLKASYMYVEDWTWIARQLQLENQDELLRFLQQQSWDQKVDGQGNLLLKKG